MKIALPVADGKLCTHFGHCEKFAVFDVDDSTKAVISSVLLSAPPHEPGLLPRWLARFGVTCVIAGGMGSRAQEIFRQNGVEVVTGALPGEPQKIIEDFISGNLSAGANICDH